MEAVFQLCGEMLLLSCSIVIPTKNRRDDVAELLKSILNQSTLPEEVIVVDDSEDDWTRELVANKRTGFRTKGVALNYLTGDDECKSISANRNKGAKNSSGDIILFLDDDVVIDKDFIEQTLKVYCTFADAKGVQGYIVNERPVSTFYNALNKVCFCFPRRFFEKDKCRAFPFSYPYPITRIIECEWLAGANSSYRREVFKQFSFDESLKGYSLCEDMDLSHRVRKRFPNSLYMSPHARLIHKNSVVARISGEAFTNILIAYSSYFFYKNVKQTLTNNLIFYWGVFVGRFILKVLTRDPNDLVVLANAVIKTSRHLKETRVGNFQFIYASN